VAPQTPLTPEETVAKQRAVYDARSRLVELGISGTRISAGRVTDDHLTRLHGREGAKALEEMIRNEPAVSGSLLMLTSLIGSVAWRAEPRPELADDAEAQWLAEWYQQMIGDMDRPLPEVVQEMTWSGLGFGWSVQEITAKLRRGPHAASSMARSVYSDGRYGIRSIDARPCVTLDRWEVDEHDRATAMHQRVDTRGRVYKIPLCRCIHFKPIGWNGGPEGLALTRGAYVGYILAKRTREETAIGNQRNLAGLPVFRVPPESLSANASTDDQAMVASLVSLIPEIRSDSRAGLVIPGRKNLAGQDTAWDFELLASSGSSKVADGIALLNYFRAEILMAFLSEFRALGQAGAGGSYSLHSDSTNMLAAALGSILARISRTIEQQLFRYVADLNGFNRTKLPQMAYSDIEKQSVTTLSAAIASLITSGAVTPGPEVEAYVRDQMGLPPRPEIAAELGEPDPNEGATDIEPIATVSVADDVTKEDSLDVPEGAREAARRGLAWRREYGRGGTEVGVARARDLSAGRVSRETVGRMVSYFARHEMDRQASGWSPGEDGYPSAGRIAWDLWGGDAGRRWAESVIDAPPADAE